ncbi:hypothetical protein GCM10007989_03550 [Devosia pacifica]|uniref:DUF2934 domain-containing protein n=1 Tax=Devosia pacifica TaxID=1335967 RepID=A0A918RV66_9HYPH|nr:DUF2934 domain-containing protein [Devosia pacifica]GHA12391.1 hypothetical protein GCM10007989_03550 [Devosia pacifica]
METEIKKRAYELWEADGRPEGSDQIYWFKAVAELASTIPAPAKPARKRTTRTRKKAA